MSSASDPFSKLAIHRVFVHRTLKGRVIYDRRKHFFNWESIGRIILKTPPPTVPGPADPDFWPQLTAAENMFGCWLILTGNLLAFIADGILDFMLSRRSALVKYLLGPALKWILGVVENAVPDPEMDPGEPERWGANLVDTVEEGGTGNA